LGIHARRVSSSAKLWSYPIWVSNFDKRSSWVLPFCLDSIRRFAKTLSKQNLTSPTVSLRSQMWRRSYAYACSPPPQRKSWLRQCALGCSFVSLRFNLAVPIYSVFRSLACHRSNITRVYCAVESRTPRCRGNSEAASYVYLWCISSFSRRHTSASNIALSAVIYNVERRLQCSTWVKFTCISSWINKLVSCYSFIHLFIHSVILFVSDHEGP